MTSRRIISKQIWASLFLVVIGLATLSRQISANDEQDGIPVFSARSIEADASSPLITNESFDSGSIQWPEYETRTTSIPQRRQDPDLDDALEDDDEEDNTKSGSTNRESIENPSYGESSRAEKDGDEIEQFFDRHLGAPPPSSQQERDTSDETQQVAQRVDVPALDQDDGDEYEAAASSQIASFLHNLIFHPNANDASSPSQTAATTDSSKTSKKRPFMIHAFSSPKTNKDEDKDKNKEDSSETANSQEADTSIAGQSQQSTAAVSSPIQAAISAGVAGYEPQMGSNANEEQVASAAMPMSGSVENDDAREIYIGRRPTIMSFLERQTKSQLQQQQQQTSTSDEQQQYMQAPQHMAYYQPHVVAAGSANVWRTPNAHLPARQMLSYQQQLPTMAASYAANYGQHQPESNNEDDEQTVTYGLSFGSRPHSSTSDEANMGHHLSGSAEQEAADPSHDQVSMPLPMLRAQQQHYQQQVVAGSFVPYSARYRQPSSMPYNQHSHSQQQQQQLTPDQQQYLLAQHYRRLQQMQQQVKQDDDNSDSMARAAANYAQSYPAGQIDEANQQQHYRNLKTNLDRQRLLASLNKELGASNSDYSASTEQRSQFPTRSSDIEGNGKYINGSQPITKFKAVRKAYLGNDLNSFNTFQAEVNPFKSSTISTRLVSAAELRKSIQPNPDQGSSSSMNAITNGNDYDLNGQKNQDNSAGLPTNLLSGPLTKLAANQQPFKATMDEPTINKAYGLRQEVLINDSDRPRPQQQQHLRVRRDDSEERDDADDDGVWVDDDEDDENRQQSSDLNETAQDPEDEEESDDTQQDAADNAQVTSQMNPPGVIGGPHGYELAPDDLMIYNG